VETTPQTRSSGCTRNSGAAIATAAVAAALAVAASAQPLRLGTEGAYPPFNYIVRADGTYQAINDKYFDIDIYTMK
jgi:polar amino acid transport system substrate-binding protein